MIQLLASEWSRFSEYFGARTQLCRAKGTNQNFRKFRLSADGQPRSRSSLSFPSLSLSHFVWTSTTEKTLGNRLLIWSSPGRNIIGCYMSSPFHTLLHIVGSHCAKFETGQAFSHVKMNSTNPNIVGPTMLGVLMIFHKVYRNVRW